MKKIYYFLTILILLITLTGCNNSKKLYGTGSIEEEKFVDLGDLGDKIKKKNIICNEIQDIVDFSFYDNLFITKDGKLYQLSFEQLYSNNSNCKQIESDKSFLKFIKGGILDNQNDIYYLDDSKELIKFNFEVGYPMLPYINTIKKEDYKNLFYAMIDIENDGYFYLENNNIYQYSKDSAKQSLLNINDEVVEYIIDGGIKTNKNYYVYKKFITNKNECEKYADVECVEEIKFDKIDNDKISNQLEHIKFIKYFAKSYIIIDENNNVYTYISAL